MNLVNRAPFSMAMTLSALVFMNSEEVTAGPMSTPSGWLVKFSVLPS